MFRYDKTRRLVVQSTDIGEGLSIVDLRVAVRQGGIIRGAGGGLRLIDLVGLPGIRGLLCLVRRLLVGCGRLFVRVRRGQRKLGARELR
jgi:hypothetical protein